MTAVGIGVMVLATACGAFVEKTGGVVANVVAGSHLGSRGSPLQARQGLVGTANATTLKSLKYFITNIELCQEMTLSGSGFSNKKGCITLYENDGGLSQTDYQQYLVTQAQADQIPGRYVDLMAEEGQAVLRQERGLNPQMVGTYRYGNINFFRPIKVTAEFPIIGGKSGEYFRTKAITNIVDGVTNDSNNTQRVEIADSRSGATEETTYMLNNGGSWFVFQKPFEITAADIEAQTRITMDLVFNPDSFGTASSMPVGGTCATVMSQVCDPQGKVVFDMPFVKMNPVPRKTGEATRKEVYLVDYATGSRASKLRIELYFNDADPEKSVQGTDLALVYESGATEALQLSVSSFFVSQAGSISSQDAVLSLLDYDQSVSLSGLRRRTDGTATLVCSHPGEMCQASGSTMERGYTYVGEEVVSSD
jgi:hypothetical protein